MDVEKSIASEREAIDELQAKCSRLESEIRILVEALRGWGRHAEACLGGRDTGYCCDCGLDDVTNKYPAIGDGYRAFFPEAYKRNKKKEEIQ